MAINYPGSLDNFTNPTSASPINSPSHADQHSNANDAIEALEAKVGANNSAITTSHDYKIAQLESLVTSAVSGAKSIYQDVRNQSGSNFVKATPVYVSGSEGSSGKMLISAASNASEATSSKTMGLTTSTISNNSNGQVISEGILEGIDTTGAVDGDPVWLGVNGAKIYGYGSIPSAPAHLVFLGIVIRGGQANTGSMYVKIQNGFELQELHNVEISSLLNGNILAYDSSTSTWKNTNTLQSTSSTVPLVIKGATSQTANLQEWQDTTGTVKALVGSGGNAVFNGIRSGSGSTTAAINAYTTAAQIGILVKGAVSQTASLQEWQDSTGAINASLTSTGDFRISNIYAITSFNNAQLNMLSTGARITTNVAANVTLTVKGAASQTADLQQWQDSAASVIAKITPAGGITVSSNITQSSSGRTFIGGAADYGAFLNVGIPTASRQGIVVRANASQTANLQEWQNSAGTVLVNVDASGNIYTSSTTIWAGYNRAADGAALYNFTTVAGATYEQASITRESGFNGNLIIGQQGTGSVLVQNGSASAIALIVKGTASQTASLQEWHSSTGTVTAKIANNGAISSISGGFFGTASAAITGGNYLAVRPWAANHVPFTVKGYSAQTGDLTRWVNDAGTTLAAVTSNGGIQAGTYNGVIVGLNYPGIVIDTSNADSTQVWLRNLSSTSKSGRFVGIKARPGYADAVSGDDLVTLSGEQYISLLGYESGKILISNDSSTPSATSYPARITFHTVAIDSTTLTERMRINNAGLVGINMTPTDAYLSVTGSSSKDAIRLYSQGGSLAFWGAGANNNIYTNGSMYMTGGNWGGTTKLAVDTGGASYNGIVIRGVASQSASLQEWQNSSGTVLGSLSANGQLYVYENAASGTGNALDINQGVGARRMIFGGGGLNVGTTVTVGSLSWNALAQFEVYPAVASRIGIVIKGAASQTADLQQWQDSAGTALAGIGPNGRIYAQGKTGNTDDLLYLRRADNNIYMYVDKDATLRGNFGIRINQEPPIDTQAFMWSGTASRSALGVSGTGSTNPTFYAKATASQTSNLTEWQDSSGTALSYIKSDGSLNFIANSNAVLISGTSTSGLNRIISNGNDFSFSPYFDGLFAPANSAGRWRPSNDATSDLGSSGQRWKDLYATSGILTNNSISKVGLIVKAIASQTANLQEWQDSSGAVLSKIDKDGNITAADLTLSGNLTVNGTTTNLNSVNLVIEDKNIIIADVATPTDTTADGAGITIKGATDKTFNWVQSTGRFTSSEPIQSSAFVSTYVYASQVGSTVIGSATLNTNSDTGGLLINTAGAANKGLTIRGAASQTANLQQWQDSNGSVLSRVQADGTFVWGSASSALQNSSGRLIVNLGSATSVGVTVKGFTSQTANLQEWQNSDAVSVAQISATGTVTIRPVGFSGNLNTAIISVTDRASTWTPGNFAFRSDSNGTPRFSFTAPNAPSEALTINGNYVGVQTPSPTSVFQVTSNGAGNTVSIIKGAVSQTANLQEWQNSAGYAGTAIDSGGSFYAPGIYSSYLMQATAGGAAVVPLTVKGVTSQTANLTEWKDSAGNAQAYVRYDGFINTNSSIRIAGDNLSVYRFQGVSDGNYTMNFPGSGNIQLFSATDSLGGGSKVLGISNATTVPSSNPTGGGILYVSSGSLVYRGAGGAITTIARSGNESSTISANTATTVDTVALSSFTTIEYTISIKQGSKVRSSKVLVHTDGTSIDSTEYGIMEMGGGITGILVTASVSSTNSILQVTITDASTTNATVKIIKTML